MITVVMYTLGVVLFVVGIAASIGLHELGHMVPAKRFGVKVTQYFIGFGNTVWSRRRGETEYGVKAIPLGGYVKLVGMLPPARDEELVEAGQQLRVRKSNTGMFTQVISDARAAEYELVEPGDEDRLFYKLPWWKKVIVMGGGPMVNLVIAFFLFSGVFMFYGVPQATTTVETVAQCVVPAPEGDRACTPADPESPAKQAGLLPGDEIVSFNGAVVTSWDLLVELNRLNETGDATITYVRAGEERTTTTNTTVSTRQSLEEDGSPGEEFVEVGFLGVTQRPELVKQGPVFAVTEMGRMTWTTLIYLGELPARVYDVGKAALGLQERDPEGPMSVVGAGRVAGEVASTHESPLTARFVTLLSLLAGINLFIGMLNLVPLLPLDGGHIAGALYEGLRRGVARLRRRPDPGYVDVAKLLPVAYVMAGVILVMSVVLIYADIVVPVSF
jgi:membrane-associated protease RseP (regulator of RpoE activity)